MNQAMTPGSNVAFHNINRPAGDEMAGVLAGLQQEQKRLSPKWFYDSSGSALFEDITLLPEYYPTRTEIGILTDYRDAIGRELGSDAVIIEPGSGSSEKIRLLLDSVTPAAYVPIDISADFLRQSAEQLGREFPWLDITAICADFNRGWEFEELIPSGRRVVFYPGSTLGNLEPHDARDFLQRVKKLVGSDGGALIGVDLHKETSVLEAAYDDAQGVTARFNLNALNHLNNTLGANFDLREFRHSALYTAAQQRVEMHLVSQSRHEVQVNVTSLHFEAGETIHTESSYKYTLEGFAKLAAQAGLSLHKSWLDEERLFSVHYLAPL